MSTVSRIVAIALLAGGTLALVYGGFSYTKDTSSMELGPISLEVEDRERVRVPVWAGVLGIVLGGGLLAAGSRKRDS